MNDITALAQRMKQQATLANGFLYVETSNVLALVEGLEKAQRYIEELREWNSGLAQESFERQQYAKERDEENQSLMLTVGRLRVERESLESRTVTVKPPQRKTVDPYCYDQGVNCKALGYNEALVDFRINLAAAGIQVIEGEQKNG